MTEDQWDALVDFIKSEAYYAANDILNGNSCEDVSRRYEVEEYTRKVIVTRDDG